MHFSSCGVPVVIPAKNPRPVCVPINNFFGIKMCVRLSNVYLAGRNLHACVDLEGYFQDETAFDYSFNCFRIGNQGIAVVAPEDGGGRLLTPQKCMYREYKNIFNSNKSWYYFSQYQNIYILIWINFAYFSYKIIPLIFLDLKLSKPFYSFSQADID